MGDEYWVHCPYAQSDECPQSDAIVRVYLFPQLLDPADIDSIKQTCKTCGQVVRDKKEVMRNDKIQCRPCALGTYYQIVQKESRHKGNHHV